ncbi:hypothetical protein [Streptomyces sp. NPDC093094]|uniref:hypothetical protein n=1 Tax=Streptomyces sp. NPDC093094 TaxID=3366026 RepID=UPI00380EFBFE
MQWLGPYSLTTAAEEGEQARRAEAEADSLRAQQRPRRPGAGRSGRGPSGGVVMCAG